VRNSMLPLFDARPHQTAKSAVKTAR
jgi:hypothetical protein